MKQFKPSVKDAMVTIDHVEETSEGLLKGGFAIIGGGEGDGISPLSNFLFFCSNSGNCDDCSNKVQGCGAPTSKAGSNRVMDTPSLSF